MFRAFSTHGRDALGSLARGDKGTLFQNTQTVLTRIQVNSNSLLPGHSPIYELAFSANHLALRLSLLRDQNPRDLLPIWDDMQKFVNNLEKSLEIEARPRRESQDIYFMLKAPFAFSKIASSIACIDPTTDCANEIVCALLKFERTKIPLIRSAKVSEAAIERYGKLRFSGLTISESHSHSLCNPWMEAASLYVQALDQPLDVSGKLDVLPRLSDQIKFLEENLED